MKQVNIDGNPVVLSDDTDPTIPVVSKAIFDVAYALYDWHSERKILVMKLIRNLAGKQADGNFRYSLKEIKDATDYAFALRRYEARLTGAGMNITLYDID